MPTTVYYLDNWNNISDYIKLDLNHILSRCDRNRLFQNLNVLIGSTSKLKSVDPMLRKKVSCRLFKFRKIRKYITPTGAVSMII